MGREAMEDLYVGIWILRTVIININKCFVNCISRVTDNIHHNMFDLTVDVM
jgi:hypothetical protein